MKQPFLESLRALMRKKTILARACLVWWNSAEGREELNSDRQMAASGMDAHSDWVANVTIMSKTPEYHKEHIVILEEQVKSIKQGEDDDVHEQLKGIEGDVNLMLKNK
jgi:hypothetical protein